jgi:hypothetical protein
MDSTLAEQFEGFAECCLELARSAETTACRASVASTQPKLFLTQVAEAASTPSEGFDEDATQGLTAIVAR